jgi:Spy/CpxP family protein refolding chaperone
MRKHSILNSLAVAALTLAMAGTANAQGFGGRGRGNPGGASGVAGPGRNVPGVPSGPAVGGQRRGGGPGQPGQPGGRRGGGPGVGRGEVRNRIANALDLTDEQKVTIAALRAKAKDDAAPIVDRLRLAQRELHRAIFADKSDTAVLKKMAADLTTLRQQLAEKRIDGQKAFAAALTPEQRLKLRTGAGEIRRRGR